MQSYLILDFDSTFVRGEALDELAEIVLRDAPDRRQRVAEIATITRAGMEGRIGFDESLRRRLGTLRPTREQLDELVRVLKASVSRSVEARRDWIRDHADRIYVISGGFVEFVAPVAAEFGISRDHILANTFEWGSDGHVSGCDQACPLAHDGGKPKVLKALGLKGPVVMVGDAGSDLAAREQGAADAFVAFTENVERPGVAERADLVAKSFDEIINSGILAELKSARV